MTEYIRTPLYLKSHWHYRDKLQQNPKLSMNCTCQIWVSVLRIPNWLNEAWDGFKQAIRKLKWFLPNTKCSDLAVFSLRNCLSQLMWSSFDFFFFFFWGAELDEVFHGPSWKDFSVFWKIIDLQKSVNYWYFYHLFLFKRRLVYFTLETRAIYLKLWVWSWRFFFFLIDLRWKEVCFWDSEVCAQMICTMCLDFPSYIVEAPLLLPRLFFLNQSLGVEDESSLKAMERQWNP